MKDQSNYRLQTLILLHVDHRWRYSLLDILLVTMLVAQCVVHTTAAKVGDPGVNHPRRLHLPHLQRVILLRVQQY